MKKTLLLSAAVLLGVAVTGAALATPRLFDDRFARWADHDRSEGGSASTGERFRLADRDHRRRHEARERHREHHDDDEDDDDDDRRDGARGRDRTGPSGTIAPIDRADRTDPIPPTDPNSPRGATAPTQAPADGLFRSRTRPRVEVN